MSEEYYEFNHKIVGYVCAIIGVLTLPVFVILGKPNAVAFVPVLSTMAGFMCYLLAFGAWCLGMLLIITYRGIRAGIANPIAVVEGLLFGLMALGFIGLVILVIYLMFTVWAWVASGGVIAILLFLILISRL